MLMMMMMNNEVEAFCKNLTKLMMNKAYIRVFHFPYDHELYPYVSPPKSPAEKRLSRLLIGLPDVSPPESPAEKRLSRLLIGLPGLNDISPALAVACSSSLRPDAPQWCALTSSFFSSREILSHPGPVSQLRHRSTTGPPPRSDSPLSPRSRSTTTQR
jgi:hypothetical protein